MENLTFPAYNSTLYGLEPNRELLIEKVCQNYVHSIDKALLTIAIFNVIYSLVIVVLRKHKDKMIFKTKIEDFELEIEVNDIITILDTMFIILNVFFFGYYLLIKNIDMLQNIKVIGWIFK